MGFHNRLFGNIEPFLAFFLPMLTYNFACYICVYSRVSIYRRLQYGPFSFYVYIAASVALQMMTPTHVSLHATATPKPTPTVKPTLTPTPTPIPPTPTPIPVQQAQPTLPPAPSCNGTIVDGTCYNTDPNGGTLVERKHLFFCIFSDRFSTLVLTFSTINAYNMRV